MALLGAVLDHGPTHTICSVECAQSELFRQPDGTIPAWLALEYMAQCIGVHANLEKHLRGGGQALGFFVGTRRTLLHADRFAPDERLRVRADAIRQGGTLVVFSCRVEREADRTLLAEGTVNVFEPRDPESFLPHPEP
jgi:predicted hotdog family 3-hydroxylacyl-ACP dehydratase